MPAVKSPPRMTKGSKARAIAKRTMADKLHAFNRRRDQAFKDAKRPGLPRIVQRTQRLAAMAAAKKAAEQQRSKLAALLGVKPDPDPQSLSGSERVRASLAKGPPTTPPKPDKPRAWA